MWSWRSPSGANCFGVTADPGVGCGQRARSCLTSAVEERLSEEFGKVGPCWRKAKSEGISAGNSTVLVAPSRGRHRCDYQSREINESVKVRIRSR